MRTLRFNRRSMLRGLLGGGAVTMGIPLLDVFLDGHGAALANGAPLPTRFATFFWGLGLTPTRWEPKTVGPNFDLPPQLAFLEGSLQKKTSVFTGFTVGLDGRPSHPHWTGMAAIMTGQCPAKDKSFDRLNSFDTVISDKIGGGTRFRSIEATPFRGAVSAYSSRGEDAFKMADDSPLALYTRLFGPGFHDPNAGDWKPDPQVLVKKSVLSAVKEQRDALWQDVGTSDRARLDQYYTAVRELEQKLDAELREPPPAEACVVPKAPVDLPRKGDVPTVTYNNKHMCELIAMALACNQTNVVNYMFTPATSEMYRPGDTPVYHAHTHEEPIDGKLGYQPISSELADISVGGFGHFLKTLEGIREGEGTLLDHALVLGYSDTGWAKIHSIDNIPMLLVGGANGRHKGGQHIKVGADPVTRVSLTAQQLVGVPVGTFGTGSMATSKPITEVMA
ncbi:DUF1552 domain-containing protein [Phenylobacterium sp. VNQ135]|uniref:DUF1552 domain-containing protein n=1 Tax=Phenylobacterium sp. VNQ135 TaxID=3400922 RepID=UPI003C0E47F5